MTTALIDGDLICYAAAYTADNPEIKNPVGFVRKKTERKLEQIVEEVGCDEYRVFLSGGNNFRKVINPEYKAQRPPKPLYLEDARKVLIKKHEAEVSDGYEADDALGMAQTDDTVICSIDKDLLMIAGQHYSWDIVRKSKIVRPAFFKTVEYFEGIKHFYKQMLIGDTADNLFGLRGVGPKKANTLLDGVTDEDLLRTIVLNMYIDEAVGGVQDLPDEEKAATARFYMNADCFWIWREMGVTYTVREDLEG